VNFDNWWLNALWSLLPTLLVGLIFWLVVRAIIHADRNERKTRSKVEAEERAKFAKENAPVSEPGRCYPLSTGSPIRSKPARSNATARGRSSVAGRSAPSNRINGRNAE